MEVFSPLTTALRERHLDIVHFPLDEADADPNAPGEHLPLAKAIRRCDDGDFPMIKLLLDKGADRIYAIVIGTPSCKLSRTAIFGCCNC